jgi:hypothetical protein
VDDTYRFININIGQPGKHHDAFVHRNSPIFQSAEERTLLPDSTELLSVVDCPTALWESPSCSKSIRNTSQCFSLRKTNVAWSKNGINGYNYFMKYSTCSWPPNPK